MFTLQFAKTTKARNSTFVPPVDGATTQVLLRENTSIVEPTFTMRLEYEGMASASELFQYNYCYCPEFKRYYFITNITSVTAVVFEIACVCDVLATFREDILNTKAFIMYAEQNYNSALADSRLPKSSLSEQKVVESTTGYTDENGSFCLTLASPSTGGETGCAQSYILSAAQMAAVSANLFSTSFYDEVLRYLTNPLDAIISCTWTPITKSNASAGGDTVIKIADYTLGSGAQAKRTVSGEQNIRPFVKYFSETTLPDGTKRYNYADYRNIEPYAEYSIWLPGVGLTQIPMHALMGMGSEPPQFTLEYAASPCSGDVTYNICRANDAQSAGDLGSTVETVTGNFGINVPVAQKNTGYMSGIGNAGRAVGGSLLSVAAYSAGHPIMAIGSFMGALSSGVSGILDVNTTGTRQSGTLGGWAATDEMYTKYEMITRNYLISDEPNDIRDTIGRPLYQTLPLSSMHGLVKCTGAYVRTWATEQEHTMIAQYVNSSTNFIFGGLIIE